MKMKQISSISTVCKNCLFAMYDGDTQIGCHFGRTEKVDDHDIFELIEAEDEDKDFRNISDWIITITR